MNNNIKLLQESIAHWQRMLDNPDCGEQPSMGDCALCQQYYLRRQEEAGNILLSHYIKRIGLDSPCDGCPIHKAGHDRCDFEEYNRASQAFDKYRDADSSYVSRDTLRERWEDAAGNMIEFLKGLKEKESANETTKETN